MLHAAMYCTSGCALIRIAVCYLFIIFFTIPSSTASFALNGFGKLQYEYGEGADYF